MSGLNKVMLIGNLGANPEMRFTPGGRAVASFSVAVSRFYTNNEGDKKQETDWFNIVAWNRLAENCNQFLLKGKRVFIEGRLRTRYWEDSSGNRHDRVEVIAGIVVFLWCRGW